MIIRKYLTITFLKLRWTYFHIHPHYIKFSMEGTEFHFHNVKDNTIYSNYEWVDDNE